MLKSLASIDLFPKLEDEVKVRTVLGALVAVASIIAMSMLFVGELAHYMRVEVAEHLFVDTSRAEKLQINFDVTFPHIPCSLLSVDAMDVSGAHQVDINHHLRKTALDKYGIQIGSEQPQRLGETMKSTDVRQEVQLDGISEEMRAARLKMAQPNYCGSCYGAETPQKKCCNSCDEVKVAYRNMGWALSIDSMEQCIAEGQTTASIQHDLQEGQGCQMVGFLEVNKVAGNFHFAPGKSFQQSHMHVHDLAAFQSGKFNVSHRINHLSFGERIPNLVNPLDGRLRAIPEGESTGMFMYYAKVVPTSYQRMTGREPIRSNQYSVTEHYRGLTAKPGQGLPGVFIFYELSPIMMEFSERRSESFGHFLTQICAIIGGVLTVAGMIDRVVHGASKAIERKMELNKLS